MTFFIIFATIMLVLCGIGAYNVVTEANDKLKKLCKIVIISCEESAKSCESYMQYYDVCFEVEGEYVQRTVLSRKFYSVGSSQIVYLNENMDCIEEVKDIEKDKQNGLFGVLIIVAMSLGLSAVVLSNFFDPDILFIIYAIAFLVIGLIYLISFVLGLGKNKKKKYTDLDVYKVPGRVIELVRNGRGYRKPIYEFYDEGIRRTLAGSVGQGRSSLIRRRVGDEVVIVIDRKTKEAYCENDKTLQKFIDIFAIGILAVVIGCVIWVVMQW